MKNKKEWTKQYYSKNKEKILTYNKIYRQNNKLKTSNQKKEYREKLKALGIKLDYKRNKQYRKKSNQQYLERLRLKIFTLYGLKCVGCNISDIDVLTIDHINDDGCLERKTQKGGYIFYAKLIKIPKRNDLQVLCGNCQLRKRKHGPDFTKWPNKQF